jgi:hypothetical protein
MALSDAIGSGPDFTADSVIDRVSRSILPDLPENVSADAVLNRLNAQVGRSGRQELEALLRRTAPLFSRPLPWPI